MKKMSNHILIPTPKSFNFRRAVAGHGWYDLPPFKYDDQAGKLDYSYNSPVSGRVESISITEESGSLRVGLASRKTDKNEAAAMARHILRLDEDLNDFYRVVEGNEHFEWIKPMNAGRLLRSGTVFEDLIKTLCTTNCSWALTRSMTRNLVEKLGESAENGGNAFPTAGAIASRPVEFYRDEIRTGYRSPYFVELAIAVVDGKVDPESWLTSEMQTPDLRNEIKKVKGIGDYAADNLLKLLGRYDGLALDSWLRAGFYKKHNREKPCPDKKIEKHYRKFGKWKGLAIWCDMTKHWFDSDEAET